MNFLKYVQFSPDLMKNITEIVSKNRVTVIENIPDYIANDGFYIPLGEQLGTLIRKGFNPFTHEIINESWEDVVYQEEHVNATYKFSNKHHPLHTDFCDSSIDLSLVYLICRKQADYGGDTIFLEAELLITLLQKYRPQLLEDIQQHDVIFGNKPHPIFRAIGKILEFDDQGPLFRWNYHVVAEENSEEVKRIAKDFHYFLETFVFAAKIPTALNMKANDAVVIHDFRVLHGRNAYLGQRHMWKAAIATSDREAIRAKLLELNLTM
jgi:hypothetical protein